MEAAAADYLPEFRDIAISRRTIHDVCESGEYIDPQLHHTTNTHHDSFDMWKQTEIEDENDMDVSTQQKSQLLQDNETLQEHYSSLSLTFSDDQYPELPTGYNSARNLISYRLHFPSSANLTLSKSESEIRSRNVKNWVEVMEMKLQVKDKDQRIDKLQDENSELKSRIDSLCLQNEDLFNITLRQHHQYTKTNMCLKQDIANLQNEIDDLQVVIDKKEGELAVFKEQEESIEDAQSTLRTIEENIRDLLNQKRATEAKMEEYISITEDMLSNCQAADMQDVQQQQQQSASSQQQDWQQLEWQQFCQGFGVGCLVVGSAMGILYGCDKLLRQQ